MKSAISFNGPVNGMMEVLLSKGIAEVMVKNMLSLDEDEITDPITADCIKEFLNMICGNFVRRLDPEKVFLLSIPTFEMISGNLHRDRQIKSHEVRLMFAAEGGNVEVSMTAARDIQ
jgi:CheY-specific phosphatase CheX